MEYEISDIAMVGLVTFLESHESDIAGCINDYSDLAELFMNIMGREPED